MELHDNNVVLLTLMVVHSRASVPLILMLVELIIDIYVDIKVLDFVNPNDLTIFEILVKQEIGSEGMLNDLKPLVVFLSLDQNSKVII